MTFRGLNVALLRLAAVCVIGLGFTFLVTLAAGAPPIKTISLLVEGGLGSTARIGRTLVVWAPLCLCSAALLITFAAGLWNIGVEGQVVMGAVFAAGLLRYFDQGGWGVIGLGIAAGALGGALWAMLAGSLRAWGRVHEIFSGLGLNFVALGLTLWLIFGPWRRPGIASMSGTEPLPDSLRLDTLGPLAVSPAALVVTAAVFVAVVVILRYTYWGLSLKAVGQNPEASRLLGIRPRRRILQAMALCGAGAGLAGALQVAGVYYRLIPSVSSSYGYSALLVAMMVSFRPALVPPVCLFFAVLNVGSIQLPMQLGIDSSLSGVIQGALVLSVFTVQGLEQVLRRRRPA